MNTLQMPYQRYKCNVQSIRTACQFLRMRCEKRRMCFPCEYKEHVSNIRNTPKTSANAYERLWMFDNHFKIITNWRRMTFASTFAIVWEHYKKWGISTTFTSYKGQRALTELFWPLGPSIKIVCLLSPDRLTILPPLKNLLRSGDFFTHFYWEKSLWFNVCFNFEHHSDNNSNVLLNSGE